MDRNLTKTDSNSVDIVLQIYPPNVRDARARRFTFNLNQIRKAAEKRTPRPLDAKIADFKLETEDVHVPVSQLVMYSICSAVKVSIDMPRARSLRLAIS